MRNTSAILMASAPPEDAATTASRETEEKTYTIGDISREFDVTLRTLRFYEHRGLLAPKRAGMARHYSERDKAKLALILKGKNLGFTLTEIRSMLALDERGTGVPEDLTLSDEQIRIQIIHLEEQREQIEGAIADLKAKQAASASRA